MLLDTSLDELDYSMSLGTDDGDNGDSALFRSKPWLDGDLSPSHQ